jgi:hypothetical protein
MTADDEMNAILDVIAAEAEKGSIHALHLCTDHL